MEELKELQNKVLHLSSDLIKEDILGDQFSQLQHLQKDNMPGFIVDIVSLYLTESEKIINDMHSVVSLKRKHMNSDRKHRDYSKIDEFAMQLKGGSVSIGAKRLTTSCEAIVKCCKENNHKGCIEGLKQLKQEFFIFKTKVEPLLSLEQEIAILNNTTKTLESMPTVNVKASVPTLSLLQHVNGVRKDEESFVAALVEDKENGSDE